MNEFSNAYISQMSEPYFFDMARIHGDAYTQRVLDLLAEKEDSDDEMQKQIDELEEKVEYFSGNSTILEDQNDKLECKIEEVEKENANLKSKMRKLKADSKIQKLLAMQDEIERLKGQIEELIQAKDKVECQRTEYAREATKYKKAAYMLAAKLENVKPNAKPNK